MIISIDELKSKFEAYDRPTAVDFDNLIDTLQTAVEFKIDTVPIGGYSNISDSINNGYTFTIGIKDMYFFYYEDGLYLFTTTVPESYGQGATQVNAGEFLHLGPRVDVINDLNQSDTSTYSSDYLNDNFSTTGFLAANYIPKVNPGNITGDMSVSGDVSAANLINPTTIIFNPANNSLEFSLYGSSSATSVDISTSKNTVITDIGYSGTLNPISAYNGSGSHIYDLDATVYIRFTESSSSLQALYRLVKQVSSGVAMSLSSNADILIVEDGSLEFLNSYSTTAEMNTAIQDASLGFDYSVESFNAQVALSGMTDGQYCMVRATVTNCADGAPNYDSASPFTDKYTDAIVSGSYYIVYSPVYKYVTATTSWDYEYQMASVHSHVVADITDFASGVTTQLASNYLSTLQTDSTATYFTQALNNKLAALPVASSIVTLSGVQDITGNKELSGSITMSSLSANGLLGLTSVGIIETITKNNGFNNVYGTTSGTVSEGDHSHSSYALAANQINKSGDSNVGKIGFGMTADSSVSLSATTGLIDTTLYVGETGVALTNDNIIVNKDSIEFGCNSTGTPTKIEKVIDGNGIKIKTDTHEFAYFNYDGVDLKAANASKMEVSTSGTEFKDDVEISAGTIDYSAGGSVTEHKQSGGTIVDVVLKERIYDLGSWDMDSISAITIQSGGLDESKVVSINLVIMDDDEIPHYGPINDESSYSLLINSSVIMINRKIGGFYDKASFSDTAVTRGYVTIKYKV